MLESPFIELKPWGLQAQLSLRGEGLGLLGVPPLDILSATLITVKVPAYFQFTREEIDLRKRRYSHIK